MNVIYCANNRVGKFQTFYGTKLCNAEGCFNKAGKLSGFCINHYRYIVLGRKPRFYGTRLCSIPDCAKKVYATDLCRTHYVRNKKNGSLIYRRNILKKCSVEGCENKITILAKIGLCRFHLQRKTKGIDLNRQWGLKGELNPHWNGGVSEYPNHYEMKRNRLQVLEEANYKCEYCGKEAKEIHHKDYSKDNHSKENLVAVCRKCNCGLRNPSKPNASKYRRLYGYTIEELIDMKLFKNYYQISKRRRIQMTAKIKPEVSEEESRESSLQSIHKSICEIEAIGHVKSP